MKVKVNIKRDVFNDIYYPYLNNEDRFLLFYGGGSSGKSYFIVERYIHKILKQKMNLLVTRQTGDTNRKSTFALFKQVIKNWNLSKLFIVNESNMRIKCKNGNEIAFSGLDDTEKLKSITFENGELTDVWVEEATECEESSINQLKVRMRGGTSKKQMVLSFNPVNINHWIKKHFIDSGLATVCFSTYKDNKFLTDEDKKVLEDFKDTDEYYHNVYCLGQWGVLGKTIFDARKIQERISQIKKPLKTGYFIYEYDDTKPRKQKISNIKWVNDDKGYIKIYQVPGSPIQTKYCIGGDTAGEGSDYFVGQVLDARTGVQVATFRNQMDPDLYTRQMYCLGKYYSYDNRGKKEEALIGIEANFDSYPIKELERLGYDNQYIREREDKYTNIIEPSLGFKTTSVTRPVIISELVKIIREQCNLLNDKETLEEGLTFVRNEKGRPEAQSGAHDDLIMALAIAYRIREQITFNDEPIVNERRFSFNTLKQEERDYGEEITIV